VPLGVAHIDQPEIAALYERKLVLVRPDGHVAWRDDRPPADPLAVIDRVRGATDTFAQSPADADVAADH
jgi:hypothetical protein